MGTRLGFRQRRGMTDSLMASVPTPVLRRAAGRPPGLPVGPGWPARLGRLTARCAYLLAAFPLGIASFVVIVTGLSVAGGMLVTLVGIPIAAGTLLAARGLAATNRAALRRVDPDVAQLEVAARPLPAKGWRRWLDLLRDSQNWLDLGHGILAFPVSTATFTVLVTWVAAAFGGITYPAWSWALPPDGGHRLFGLTPDWPWVTSVAYVVLGAVCLLTLPAVVAGLTRVHVGLARALLVDPVRRRRRVATLEASNRAVVDAEADSLRRLERDLHDGPQQRLVRLQMDLGSVRRRVGDDPETARLLEGALAQTKDALAELRALSRGIAPPVLTDRGLPAALGSLAARSTVPVELSVDLPPDRLPLRAETAVYFVAAEALTNVAKHSGARHCEVDVWEDGGMVRITVGDDGTGGAALAKGSGLAGLADRLAGLDGVLDVVSPVGGPTRLTAALPTGRRG